MAAAAGRGGEWSDSCCCSFQPPLGTTGSRIMIAAGCGGPTKIGSAGGSAGGRNGGVGNQRRRGCSQAQGGISAAPTASAACQWLLRARVELLCGVRAGTGVAAQGPPAQERLARPRGAAALPVHLQMRPDCGLPPWPPLGAAFFARTSWPGPVAAPPAAQSTQAGVLHREGKGIWAKCTQCTCQPGLSFVPITVCRPPPCTKQPSGRVRAARNDGRRSLPEVLAAGAGCRPPTGSQQRCAVRSCGPAGSAAVGACAQQ